MSLLRNIMVKVMNINKISVIVSIVLIILIISVPTFYKVVKNHVDNLYLVVEDKIIESARKCYLEDKCLNEKITLKELYDNNYLDKVIDPISKEYYSESCYVLRDDNNFEFIVVR